VPFEHPKEASTFALLDKEEHRSFNEMSESHSRLGRLDGPKGHRTFSQAWDLHVANRVRERHEGISVQTINRKSIVQLQEHYDNLKKHQELLPESMNNNDEQLQLVERVFKRTRRELEPTIGTSPLWSANGTKCWHRSGCLSGQWEHSRTSYHLQNNQTSSTGSCKKQSRKTVQTEQVLLAMWISKEDACEVRHSIW